MHICITSMKRILLLAIILLQMAKSFAQPDNRPLVPKYPGDTITITGRIYAGNYLKNVITKPTFLNVYDSSPMHMLMIRIDSNDRKNFPDDPEKYYLNKKVSIRGVLADYKGISTMKLVSPSVVHIDYSDKGPEPITSTGSYMSGHDFGFGASDSLFRRKQDSVRKILAADPTRKNKVTTPKVQPNPVIVSPEKSVTKEAEITQTTPETKPEPVIKEEKTPETEPAKEQPETIVAPTPPADSIKTEEAHIIEIPETDTIVEEQPDVVKKVTLKNIPRVKSEATKPLATPATRAEYLKTISNQEFEAVNEVWSVKDGEIEMRTSPNMDAPVLAYLMKQMTIRITNKSKKWSYVTVENPDGTTGLSGFIKNKVYKDMDKKE